MVSYVKGIGAGCFWSRISEIPVKLIGTWKNDDDESFIEF